MRLSIFLLLFKSIFICSITLAQNTMPVMQYSISIDQPQSHNYHVQLQTSGWQKDTLDFKMPQWMPGYYQLMNYAADIENISAHMQQGNTISVIKFNNNTWRLTGIKNKTFVIDYSINTKKKFVANSYVDSAHAYLVATNSFLYVDGYLKIPVSVKIELPRQWNKIATGLSALQNKKNTFFATGFDELYDCPILMGNLEQLPSFYVNGIEHRFIGYNMGIFDHKLFMDKLKKVVEAAVNLIGDIPYKQYTFIGIGPGRGGIEHLNNTTVSFDGSGLTKPAAMNRVLNFLAHEYYHHYNVKRIRPFELGPFDYDKENRTNLLWVSEGLSVYYEYLIVKRAGLSDLQTLLHNFESNINAVENNPGRLHQSLTQASYNTWKEGPFGTLGAEAGKTISYYDKGPVVGLLLDISIRNATQNKKSLDDVMRFLYYHFYKKLQRGFTDAEFQQTCESIAGRNLTGLFDYVYTTKAVNYENDLAMGGLVIAWTENPGEPKTKLKATISLMNNPDPLQAAILKSWLGEE
jgi:predicted metalloprotease with PDZ domain